MKLIALALSFVAMFGAAWMVCMRASDWRTDRWDRKSRAFVLALGPIAWLLLVLIVRAHIYPGNLRSDEMKIALFLGFPCGIAIYSLLAWIRPGTAGARRIALIAHD
jgi:hypothetical protein